jgi:hypothetical protein
MEQKTAGPTAVSWVPWTELRKESLEAVLWAASSAQKTVSSTGVCSAAWWAVCSVARTAERRDARVAAGTVARSDAHWDCYWMWSWAGRRAQKKAATLVVSLDLQWDLLKENPGAVQ